MRMFYRSAPVFMALSVALAGCSDADSPGAKSSAADTVKPSAGSTATTANSAATTEVCLTVDGMH